MVEGSIPEFFKCDGCPRMYQRKSSLDAHIDKKHGSNVLGLKVWANLYISKTWSDSINKNILFREGQNFLAVIQGKIDQRRAKKLPSVPQISQGHIQSSQVIDAISTLEFQSFALLGFCHTKTAKSINSCCWSSNTITKDKQNKEEGI